MRVLVCGGRDYANAINMRMYLDQMLEKHGAKLVIIQGGARGADALARDWADSRAVPCVNHPARWGAHGKAAGYIRNVEMLKEWDPDLVMAFPGGKGTEHMTKAAVEANVLVALVDR